MKVLLFNCGPHEFGCTYTALKEISVTLSSEGIENEIIHIGGKVTGGCKACGACRTLHRCVIDDAVNAVLDKVAEADGYVFGSPVHYSSACADACAFLDRLFYSNSALLAYKPGACVVSCRRAGTTAAFERLNQYLTINNMPVVSSQYWNMVHGNTPDDVLQDREGLQIMRTLGHNMAWLLKCIDAGKANGIVPVNNEPRMRTNFIENDK